MVSLAGPLSNLALAIICVAAMWALQRFGSGRIGGDLFRTSQRLIAYTVAANLGLCIFNLVPLFPLDGHHVLRELLPGRMQDGYMTWQRSFGMALLAILILGPVVLRETLGRQGFNPLGQLRESVINRVLLMFGWKLV